MMIPVSLDLYPTQFQLDKFYAVAEQIALASSKSPFKGVKVKWLATSYKPVYVVERGPTYVGTYKQLQEAVEVYRGPEAVTNGVLCSLADLLGKAGEYNPKANYSAALQAAFDYATARASHLILEWNLEIYDNYSQWSQDFPASIPVADFESVKKMLTVMQSSLAREVAEHAYSALWDVSIGLSSIRFTPDTAHPDYKDLRFKQGDTA